MQTIISQIAKLYSQTEDGQQELAHYVSMKDHPGWKAHQSLLINIGNHMATAVLSKGFRKKTDQHKLIDIEAYGKVNEIIRFLLNPTKPIMAQSQIRKHNLDAEANFKK